MIPRLICALSGQRVVQVALGASHTVFLTVDGRLLSCGLCQTAQSWPQESKMSTVYGGCTSLGQDCCAVREMPWKPPARVQTIDAADQLTAFVLDDGRVYLCGVDRAGCWESDVLLCGSTLIEEEVEAARIGGCLNLHTLIKTCSGNVFTSGANNNGQLGRSGRERDIFLWPPPPEEIGEHLPELKIASTQTGSMELHRDRLKMRISASQDALREAQFKLQDLKDQLNSSTQI